MHSFKKRRIYGMCGSADFNKSLVEKIVVRIQIGSSVVSRLRIQVNLDINIVMVVNETGQL